MDPRICPICIQLGTRLYIVRAPKRNPFCDQNCPSVRSTLIINELSTTGLQQTFRTAGRKRIIHLSRRHRVQQRLAHMLQCGNIACLRVRAHPHITCSCPMPMPHAHAPCPCPMLMPVPHAQLTRIQTLNIHSFIQLEYI